MSRRVTRRSLFSSRIAPSGSRLGRDHCLLMADLPAPLPLDEVAAPVMAGEGGGRVVALVASDESRRGGWAPVAAHSLAARWASEGHRIVLADAGLDDPSLHVHAGVPNREGVSDAALFGASAGRVSHPMDGYLLITAGAPVAQTMSIVRDPRWARFSEGMAEAGVMLMLYLLDGEPCTPGFLGSASDIIILGAAEDASFTIRDLEPLVRAVTAPTVPVSDGNGVDVLDVDRSDSPEPGPVSGVDTEGGAAAAASAVDSAGADAAESVAAEPGATRKIAEKRTRRPSITFVVVLVLVVAVAAWLLWMGPG